jgi:putative (di)nucleoside polyphosphate hydrolase
MFRKGIVAVLRNAGGEVLLGERSDMPGAWQFPQGGIEPGETPLEAFVREVREELGTSQCRVLREGAGWPRYEWPERGRDGVLGQEQRWFLGELDGEPNLASSDGCFRAWRYVSVKEALSLVVAFKRAAYEEGLRSLGLVN